MLNLTFSVVAVQTPKPYDLSAKGGPTGISYKVDAVVDGVLGQLKLTPELHAQLGQVAKNTDMSGQFELVKATGGVHQISLRSFAPLPS